MSELHDLTALEQGAAIRRGEVSTAELVEHYLGRIDQHAEKLGAFVTVTAEQARAAAPVGDGPLAGVPTAIKDLNATRGVRTSFGSPVFADFVPDFDDEVVRRIEAAGMVSLGKTSTPEFGSPCYTEPEGAPPAVTPWDTDADGRRLERRIGIRGVGRAGAGGAGVRRRRLDPDPGQLLRHRRAEADARADLRCADVRRPDRPRDQRRPRANRP